MDEHEIAYVRSKSLKVLLVVQGAIVKVVDREETNQCSNFALTMLRFCLMLLIAK